MTERIIITGLADDTEDLLFDDDGNPRIGDFSSAVQMWTCCQESGVTVHDAAAAFRATAEVIRQAVTVHPFLTLDGDKIETDGT